MLQLFHFSGVLAHESMASSATISSKFPIMTPASRDSPISDTARGKNVTQNEGTEENTTDIALMQLIAQGDEQAFESLIERHQYAVIGTVAKMLGNYADAEDIAQQVFIRLWKSAARYEPKAKFTTYLFTITRNLVFNESRKKKRRKEHSVEEREDDHHLQTPDEQALSPDKEALQQELQSAVDSAIASLPEKQRMAVILRRYEGMPYEEIAKVLELSISAVKSQLFRARTTLREALQQYMDA